MPATAANTRELLRTALAGLEAASTRKDLANLARFGIAALVDDPALVTPAQMDRWCRDFDNWGICDTVCFKLFDQSPHAWSRVAPWCRRREEFIRRAGFALLACLASHDKASGDAPFARALPLIERAANDERNFVKKGVSWALRCVGRRSPALHAASLKLARQLAESADPTERWLGRDAIRDLTKPAVVRRLAAAAAAKPKKGRIVPRGGGRRR